MFEDWYLNELFSDKIKKIWKLTDYYLLKCIFNIFDETGILSLLKNNTAVNDIIAKKNYPQKVYSALKWMMDRLVIDGFLTEFDAEKDRAYKLSEKKMVYDLNEIKDKAVKEDESSIAAFNMLKLMSDNYPAFLKGEINGIDIIFSPSNIATTNEYYRNNLFYNVHNKAGAKALNWDIDSRINPVILEIGGGLGGGTCEFLHQRLQDKKSINSFKYYFTDIANKMLRTTKKEILKLSDDSSAFEYTKLNFDKSLNTQGFADNSVDIIWGVNAAHVAIDLKFTLNEFLKILKPGGSIILSETVRPEANRMIQQELLLNTIEDYWNVNIDDFRPHHGFMDWLHWINALTKVGFKDVATIPDMNYLQTQYDNCYVAVIRGVKK